MGGSQSQAAPSRSRSLPPQPARRRTGTPDGGAVGPVLHLLQLEAGHTAAGRQAVTLSTRRVERCISLGALGRAHARPGDTRKATSAVRGPQCRAHPGPRTARVGRGLHWEANCSTPRAERRCWDARDCRLTQDALPIVVSGPGRGALVRVCASVASQIQAPRPCAVALSTADMGACALSRAECMPCSGRLADSLPLLCAQATSRVQATRWGPYACPSPGVSPLCPCACTLTGWRRRWWELRKQRRRRRGGPLPLSSWTQVRLTGHTARRGECASFWQHTCAGAVGRSVWC